MERSPRDSYSLTLRVKLSTRAGTLGEVATAIGKAGGDIGAIDIVSAGRDYIIRDITFNTVSSEHEDAIVKVVEAIDGIEVLHVSDRTFLMHIGWKIEVVSKMPLKTRADLSMARQPRLALKEPSDEDFQDLTMGDSLAHSFVRLMPPKQGAASCSAQRHHRGERSGRNRAAEFLSLG